MVKKYLFLTTILLISSAITSVSFGKTKLIFSAVNYRYEPYLWKDHRGKITGSDAEVIKEISNRLGVEIEIRLVPWKRVLFEVETGFVLGGFPAFKTPEREKYAIYVSTPLRRSIYRVFVKKNKTFKFNNINDLYGKTIAITRGNFVSEDFVKAKNDKKIIVKEFDNPDATAQMLKKLMVTRLDGVIGNTVDINKTIERLKLDGKIVALPKIVNNFRSYLIISKAKKIKNKKGLIANINKVLKQMEKDGTLNKIHSKYGIE